MQPQHPVVAYLTRVSLVIGLGVGWSAWPHVGFWWATLYGLFWEPWLGFRIAEYLLR